MQQMYLQMVYYSQTSMGSTFLYIIFIEIIF